MRKHSALPAVVLLLGRFMGLYAAAHPMGVDEHDVIFPIQSPHFKRQVVGKVMSFGHHFVHDLPVPYLFGTKLPVAGMSAD